MTKPIPSSGPTHYEVVDGTAVTVRCEDCGRDTCECSTAWHDPATVEAAAAQMPAYSVSFAELRAMTEPEREAACDRLVAAAAATPPDPLTAILRAYERVRHGLRQGYADHDMTQFLEALDRARGGL